MMKILIEIPKHIYEHAKEKSEDGNDEWDAMRAIANGTPLPEHHGDLIDRDELLIKSEWYGERATYSNPIPNGETAVPEEVVLNAPTIIEGTESE